MSHLKKIKFAQDLINITFWKGPATSEEVLIFIPGGPGLSSQYFMPFLDLIKKKLTIDIALMDLPNHNASEVLPGIDFLKASNLIHSALNEVACLYGKTSIFAHSIGGALFLAEPKKSLQIEDLFLCGVPFEFETSELFKIKKAELFNCPVEVKNNQGFKSYFDRLAVLYFQDRNKYNPTNLARVEKEDSEALRASLINRLKARQKMEAYLKQENSEQDIISQIEELDQVLVNRKSFLETKEIDVESVTGDPW